MDTDRDEVRALFTAVLADPPPLGFSPSDVERAARRRPRWVTLTAAAAAVVLIAAGIAVLGRGGDSAAPPATRPTASPAGPTTVTSTVLGGILGNAARNAGATPGPVVYADTDPVPTQLPGEADAGRRYRSVESAVISVRTATGEVGTLWTSVSRDEDSKVQARPADSCTQDASAARTEDACTPVRLFGGPLVRVAHHGGTRPREIWTAYLVQPDRLIQVVLVSAGLTGDEPQLEESLFTCASTPPRPQCQPDYALADLVGQVLRAT